MDNSKTSNKSITKLNHNKFGKIKSNYILQEIFGYLSQKKSLEIIKYNNRIKRGLNISINTYKEYCEKYTSIELEIIPVANKFDEFINIDKEYKPYYHIYFDDNKEEKKRNKLNEKDKVNKINIKIDYQVQSFYKLFDNCDNIKSINFKKCFRNINNMKFMFSGCSSLKEIKFSNFNTKNVTDMTGMFLRMFIIKRIKSF